MTRKIGLVLYPDYQLLDAAGPMAAFEAAYEQPGVPSYDTILLSAGGGFVRSPGGARLSTSDLNNAPVLDTVIVCGGIGALEPHVDDRILSFVNSRLATGARIASVCTGAFILASGGILDGRRATTHWRFAAELARRFPAAQVEPDRIWVRDGAVWTSAGVSAGIDLALALITEDLGDVTARRIAQELVVFHRRPGGQSQFSALLDIEQPSGRFGALLGWVCERLDQPLTVEQLAEEVAMSPRHFSRAFHKETGMTPAKAIEQIRLEAAREWVERGTHTLGWIARATGFRSTDRMRRAFLRSFGMPPRAIRRAF